MRTDQGPRTTAQLHCVSVSSPRPCFVCVCVDCTARLFKDDKHTLHAGQEVVGRHSMSVDGGIQPRPRASLFLTALGGEEVHGASSRSLSGFGSGQCHSSLAFEVALRSAGQMPRQRGGTVMPKHHIMWAIWIRIVEVALASEQG